MANASNPETKPLTEGINSLTNKPKIQPKYNVQRNVLTHELVIKQTGYSARDKSIPYALRKCWQNWSFCSLFIGVLPIVQWLPKYKFRQNILGDIIAGITVAIMAIPHGIAYGILAGVDASNGLYVGIFPVLIYMIFGTSRHISIGTFAVISMMTRSVVYTHSIEEVENQQLLPADETRNLIKPLDVATALAVATGLVHLAMSFLRLGTLASLLSEPLVNGFTTGAACHVVTAQLKEVIGVQVIRHKGAFKIIYTLVDLVKSIPNTNMITFVFCITVMAFMVLCNELIKPFLSKRCRFPFPGELIAVIGGTLISQFLRVEELYKVTLVGEIPEGLPAPVLPRLELIPAVIVESIPIAVVSFSIVMSMGLTFAKKNSYEVYPNQELLALGISNMVSGCFACYPLGCSLSRSVIQEQTGGATQLASLVSAFLVIMTLLWAGPFFSALPRCVLAAVIIVALKPMFTQVKQLKKFGKQGKLEVLTWLGTFLAVVIIDIDIGLIVGISLSILALYIKGIKPNAALLGTIPEAQAVYVDIKHHRNAVEVPDTKIFRYTGSLNFATGMFYRRALYDALDLDISKIRNGSYMLVPQKNGNSNGVIVTGVVDAGKLFRFLILDFSMLGHIDVAGCHTLTEISTELKPCGVRILLASPVDRVYDTLIHSLALGEGPFEIFPTLHDAAEFARALQMS